MVKPLRLRWEGFRLDDCRSEAEIPLKAGTIVEVKKKSRFIGDD